MEDQQYPHRKESIFSDDLLNQISFQPATRWQRFFNLFIDSIVMNWGLGFVTAYVAVYTTLMINPDFRIDESADGQLNMLLYWWILSIINYLIYYTICEKAFKGYTLGKLLTGTRAIRQDGTELTLRDVLLRTLSRLVPFEAFSGFGERPWHDEWTKTTVIRSR
jgi:uncharacterized RDD family membrane protein YckC